ncbi:hypothetical protein Hanom_Chr10g00958921 [Helianthus anomalus]
MSFAATVSMNPMIRTMVPPPFQQMAPAPWFPPSAPVIRTMVPPPFQQMAPAPWFSPSPPVTNGFGTPQMCKKELERLIAMKGTEQHIEGTNDKAKETATRRLSKFLENNRISLDTQEKISLEAANGLMVKLKTILNHLRL